MESNSKNKEYESNVLRPIHLKDQSNSGNVKVVCRVRPLNNKEISKGDQCCLNFLKGGKEISINMSSVGGGNNVLTHKFEYD